MCSERKVDIDEKTKESKGGTDKVCENICKKFCDCLFNEAFSAPLFNELSKNTLCFLDENHFFENYNDLLRDINKHFGAEMQLKIEDYIQYKIGMHFLVKNDKQVNPFASLTLDNLTAFPELIQKEIEEQTKLSNVCLPEAFSIIIDKIKYYLQVYQGLYFAVRASYNRDIGNAVGRINSLDENLNTYETKINENKEKLKDYEDKLEKGQRKLSRETKRAAKKTTETSITILGIFASIVLVFNASVSFYSAAIEAFSDSGIYKITFILSLIGFITLSAIYGLIFFLDKTHYPKMKIKFKTHWPFIAIIVILLIVMLVSLVLNHFDIQQQVETNINVNLNTKSNVYDDKEYNVNVENEENNNTDVSVNGEINNSVNIDDIIEENSSEPISNIPTTG